MEEASLKQQSRMKWLHLGDCNTKFFHQMVKVKKRASINARKKIQLIEGSVINDKKILKDNVVLWKIPEL